MVQQDRPLIIGAGMSGLACATHLMRAGVTPLVLEAGDAVGGRVRTDRVEGFLLDRGFQVLLTAYPEAQGLFDYASLQLRAFEPGALIYVDGTFQRLSDPWRRPRHAWATMRSSVGSIADKLRIAATRRRVCAGSLESLNQRPQQSTHDYLLDRGFSQRVIDRFLRPFLAGIFLESDLSTSSRAFEFVFRMFSQGDAALPAAGMGQLSQQLADRLPEGSLRLNTRVQRIDNHGVTLENGEVLAAPAVVVAGDSVAASRLLGSEDVDTGVAVTCLYFAAPQAPVDEAILILNGTAGGPVNNLCFPHLVSSEYAPVGQALVSASVLGSPAQSDAALETEVRAQMTAWFGEQVDQWRLLRIYRIPQALPSQDVETMQALPREVRLGNGRYLCGDHTVGGSLQAALVSGRRAAEAYLADQ